VWYEVEDGNVTTSALELEYEKWNKESKETEGDTLTCSDAGVLGGVVRSVTWNLREGEVLATVDREKQSNVSSECDSEVSTWNETVRNGKIDGVRVMLYDDMEEVNLTEWIQAKYRLLPNGALPCTGLFKSCAVKYASKIIYI
jgi:hypothetical protein